MSVHIGVSIWHPFVLPEEFPLAIFIGLFFWQCVFSAFVCLKSFMLALFLKDIFTAYRILN